MMEILIARCDIYTNLNEIRIEKYQVLLNVLINLYYTIFEQINYTIDQTEQKLNKIDLKICVKSQLRTL